MTGADQDQRNEAAAIICRVCREPIRSGARRCPLCLSYQARWRNALPVIALTAALLVLIGGVIAGAMVAATNLSTGDEIGAGPAEGGVDVIAFATGGSLVVRNAREEDAFIESLTVESDVVEYLGHVILGAVAFPGTFQVITQPSVPGGPLVANVTDEVWRQVLDRQFPNVQPRFYSAGHVYLRAVQEQLGDGIRTIPARCRLGYHTLSSPGQREVAFDCTGVFVRIDAGEPSAAPSGN